MITLRARFLMFVLGAVFVPMALLGFWLTRSAESSGATLLRARLDSALTLIARDAGSQWVQQRSTLLALAEHPEVRQVLAMSAGRSMTPRRILLPRLTDMTSDVRRYLQRAVISDLEGTPRWSLALPDDGSMPALVAVEQDTRLVSATGGLRLSLPVYSAVGATLGSLELDLFPGAVVVPSVAGAAGAGAIVAIVDRARDISLLPLPFDPVFLDRPSFTWTGEEWLTARRALDDPPITLVAAAPLGPFRAPFQRAAKTGLAALVVLSLVVIIVTVVLTGRLTGRLEHLALAADAVSRGNLDQRLDAVGRDEVSRVGRAFNTMTASLQQTLRQLSERQSVAAVGEFASTLAHEIRNPLSAIRLNLQSVSERLRDGDPSLAQTRQALSDIERLDRTLGGALQVARSGRVTLRPIELREPLEAAIRSAQPEFTRRGAVLEPLPVNGHSTRVRGDAVAMERLFLNLLLNAAQSLREGEHAGVEIASEGTRVDVNVWDRGCGMNADSAARAFEPFFSTKPEGTGLGLAVARQIVAAHGGEIWLDSAPGKGTTVRVTLASAT